MPGSGSSAARLFLVSAGMALVFGLWLAVNSFAGGIGFFYAVPIGFATWWFGLRAGAIAALTGCCLYALGNLIDPVDNAGFALGLRVIAFGVVVVCVAAVRERLLELEHGAEELSAIRAALTPSALPDLPGVEAAAAFVPSEYGVSGDFYLLTNGPDETTVAVVGDVVGHGPRSARLATFLRARFAAIAAGTSDPVEILSLANDALIERGGGKDEEIASAVCLRFHAGDSLISFAIAGHPPPLCLPSLNEVEPVGTTTLLGVSENAPFATAELRLGRSDGMLVYTDGATDVRRGGSLLGPEGLRSLLAPLAKLPPRKLTQEAQSAVLDWTDRPLGDDLCLLALRPKF